MTLIDRTKAWANQIKRDVIAVYFAARDPRTPIHVRLFGLIVAAYALSPIDLIPDFIPVIGYLDDLVLLPLGILILVRTIPPEVLSDSRAKANTVIDKPKSITAAIFIVFLWLAFLVAIGLKVFYATSI